MSNYVLNHTGAEIDSILDNAENKTNKVTSLSSSSTDTQYPSAKLLYDQLALKQNSSSAFSGNYNDLTNKPTIPTVGNTKVYYGTCATKNSTAAKVVVCNGFVLETGATIVIKMTNAMTASSATLNINGTGAIALKYMGTGNAGKYYWNSGEIVTVTYDGTNYIMHDGALATTTYYGVTKLATSATSTSISTALTPASLNSLVNGMIADYPIYSTTTAYAIGDKVRYGYNNWQCNTAIAEGGEDWTAGHWTQLPTLQEQIDTLGSGGGGQGSYTLTSQDKADIAALVIAELDGNGVSY